MPSDYPPPRSAAALGDAIRTLREEQQITVEELAAATGLSPGQLAALEAGRLDPGCELLVLIAGGLGVQVAALLERAAESVASARLDV